MRLVSILSVSLFLIVVWQLSIFLLQIPSFILASPLDVLQVFVSHYDLLLMHAWPTLIEILLGFSLGILFGILGGCMLDCFSFAKRWLLPCLIISQAIPTFALAPLLVIWLGFGLTSKVAMSILMIFFPVTSNFYDGLQRTPSAWLELAKSEQATRWRTFWLIRMPAALPSLASGMRIAAVIAPIGAVVGEWVGSSKGLGYLMLNANARLQIDQLFAALILLMILALGLYFLVDRLLKRWVWWSI